MKLIRRQGYKIVVADEAFLIKSIRLLFEADESEDKQFFFKEISYLYFMVDPSSSLSYIKDDEERSQTIIEQEGLSKNFKPSKLLKTAMQDYGKHTVTTSQLLLYLPLHAQVLSGNLKPQQWQNKCQNRWR